MEGHTSSITELAIVVVAALCCGLIVRSFRQPILLGYILAGAALGPSGFGFVENRDQVQLLAELGVLMLLFFIGMELQLRSLKAVWRIALMTTLFQIAVGVLAMSLLGFYLDWPIGLTVVLGFVVALSSTAIAIKMLEEIGEKGTRVGNVTIGILIAQDLAVIPMMLVVSTFTGENASIGAGTLIKLGLSIAFLGILLVYLGRGRRLRLPFAKSVGRNADLTPLAGLAFCFGAAALSGLMELSASYGAFLAGLVIGNSTSRRVMMHYTAPIQSVLLMVFFLTIGLLMDLGYIWENLGTVILIVTFVAILKTALNIVVIRAMGETWPRAFLSGVMLAQLGEFSFILAALGLTAGVISPEEHRLLVAVTVLSLIGSPIWLEAARRLHRIALLGITSGRETLRLTLGPEAKALGRSGGLIGGRIGDWLRRAAGPLAPKMLGASQRDQKPLAPDAGPTHNGGDLDGTGSPSPRRSPSPPLNPGGAEAD